LAELFLLGGADRFVLGEPAEASVAVALFGRGVVVGVELAGERGIGLEISVPTADVLFGRFVDGIVEGLAMDDIMPLCRPSGRFLLPESDALFGTVVVGDVLDVGGQLTALGGASPAVLVLILHDRVILRGCKLAPSIGEMSRTGSTRSTAVPAPGSRGTRALSSRSRRSASSLSSSSSSSLESSATLRSKSSKSADLCPGVRPAVLPALYGSS
jgi:hypothetical protein